MLLFSSDLGALIPVSVVVASSTLGDIMASAGSYFWGTSPLIRLTLVGSVVEYGNKKLYWLALSGCSPGMSRTGPTPTLADIFVGVNISYLWALIQPDLWAPKQPDAR